MAAKSNPSEQELKELDARLMRAARKLVPAQDCEDLKQEAMLRVATEEVEEDAPPLAARGIQKLRDAQAEHYRKLARKSEPPEIVPLDEDVELQRPDVALSVVEWEDLIVRTVGVDAMNYVKCQALGFSANEIGEILGWTTKEVDAMRKQVARKLPDVARSFFE